LRQFFQQSGLGAIHVTVGKFYRPSGASTQLKGVVPDIILPSDTDLPDIGESQLPNALPWDTISPTTYAPLSGLRPQLSSLREKSQARVAADPGFRLVRLQEAMVRRNAETRWLTLNEDDRRSERAKADEIAAELNQFAIAKAVPVRPAQYITLADPDPAKSYPVRKPRQIREAIIHSEAANLEEDLGLGEAENILADYIQGMQSASGGPAAATADEREDAVPIPGSARRN
jgi:carboxyl-terminal processing protease